MMENALSTYQPLGMAMQTPLAETKKSRTIGLLIKIALLIMLESYKKYK